MKGPLESSSETDPLDQLLGLSPLPPVDPWFAARTVARCRLSDSSPERVPFFHSMNFWSRYALPGLFVLFAAGISLQQAHRIHTLKMHHRQDRVREAFQVISSMGNDSDSSWQDSSL
jgi:hypothetical protein